MKYKVTHYHDTLFGPYKDLHTVYSIEAETPREAAIIAHGLYNRYDIADILNSKNELPYRSVRERLEDTIKASMGAGKNTPERSAFLYDNIAGHVIRVELEKFEEIEDPATEEARELAQKIRENSEWDPDDCKELCEMADLEAEWEAADGDNFEEVLQRAANILHVEII